MQGDQIVFNFDTKQEADAAIERVNVAKLCFSSGKRAIGEVWMVVFKLNGPNFIEEQRAAITRLIGDEPFVIELTSRASRYRATA